MSAAAECWERALVIGSTRDDRPGGRGASLPTVTAALCGPRCRVEQGHRVAQVRGVARTRRRSASRRQAGWTVREAMQ